MLLDPASERAMTDTLSRRRTSRPARRLLLAVLELAGEQAELVSHAERPWASVTFTGARHTLALAFTGVQEIEAGERFVEALPDHEFAVPGQLVADAAIMLVEHEMLPCPRMLVEAELLLLEDT